ncbi:MAG: AAA family ATPase [Bryobacteraceae bacterium]
MEPAILASLVTEDPLLLIGPHGTGKSMLLERLAQALGLCYRHYNASLICFDDLIGFPVPEQGSATLKYLQTPATIWEAEAVFFDEVSRCRPDVQNKLFSIIHGRKVQGLTLERLRYRWSAMNPPMCAESGENYRGSEPLDTALADRYAFIVEIPHWFSLSPEAQKKLLERGDKPPDPKAGPRLQDLLEQARPVWRRLREGMRKLLTDYLRYLAALLLEGEISLSARRLVTMMRNITAVHAVRLVLEGGHADLDESARIALFSSIPAVAEGRPVDRGRLAAAHTEAWRSGRSPEADELIQIFCIRDPLERAVAAARSEPLSRYQRSIVVADCLHPLVSRTNVMLGRGISVRSSWRIVCSSCRTGRATRWRFSSSTAAWPRDWWAPWPNRWWKSTLSQPFRHRVCRTITRSRVRALTSGI